MNQKSKKEIVVNVLYERESCQLKTYPDEYRSLMTLISDKMYVEGFGECGGMGRCGTCMVELEGNLQESTRTLRNEESTLKKLGADASNIRLACQIRVDASLHDLTISIREFQD